jgi:hypothetical protein
VGHQEGAGEPWRCAHQGGDPIQFEIAESNFESTSESKPPSLQIDANDVYDLQFGRSSCSWKAKEIIFLMQPVSWSTKIGVTRNH